jgi:glycosyltransferase involved in cell wall biosynthesis
MIFTEHFNATYFISFDIPLRESHKQGKASFRAYSQQDVAASGMGCWRAWLDDFKPDVVFMTRYGQADGVDIVRDCKVRGIPVVYHIDDNLLELPPSLGAEIVKRQGAAIHVRQTMLSECDVIYASTRVLARTLGEKFPGRPVYQGIYASYFPIETSDGRTNADTVGYMGSKGHKEDLALVVPALLQLMRERPMLRFETFGTIEMPEEMRQFGERVRHHAVQKSYREFLHTLAGLHWSVGLAPLVDEPFNRCKAPTKFIEYTGCGIPVAASDIIVYSSAIPAGAGVLVGSDWAQAIGGLLDDPQGRGQMLDSARSYCQRAFSPELLQQQLLEVAQRAQVRNHHQP